MSGTSTGNTLLPPPRRSGNEKSDLAALYDWCNDIFGLIAVEANVIGTNDDLAARVEALENTPVVLTFNARSGDVLLDDNDVIAALGFTPANVAASVISFNARVGAVTLTALDVTTALTFTPANAATLTEDVQDIVGAMIVAAGGSYDDPSGAITLPGGGGGGGSSYFPGGW